MEITLPLEKEIRFAVVMYGGVSLAIYIHGVSQELYHLVRATARKVSDPNRYHHKNVKGVEVVYRKLGEHLKAKFVADILSGTSAGGINSVYLAKALANDQEITELQRLWKEQGDIALLVNDQQSARGIPGLKNADKPSSLLNSRRMYFELLNALREMGNQGISKKGKISPYVAELDLFVTATDIDGLALPLRIIGANTYEHRYRNVFHFHYSTARAVGSSEIDGDDRVYWNDFSSENDPFLAFAARSTSSFPFAFEPMRLDDVESILKLRPFQQVYRYDPVKWSRFYKDYQRPGEDFSVRSFGDGGYLDNKPFSYATETLLRRRADLPVDRKLIYIDPTPEHPEEKENSRSVSVRPDALENVAAALLTLPRYETIRGDLQTIAQRNEVIKRTNRIMSQIDYLSPFALRVKSWQLKGAQWAGKFLDEQTVMQYGPSYPAYHQLRVESVLDDMASAFSRAMGWDENSEQKKQLLVLLQGWRREFYTADPNDRKSACRKTGSRRSENDILFRLDSRWRMRRIHFMQDLIDTLMSGLDSLASSSVSANGKLGETASQAQRIVRLSGATWKISNDGEKAAYRSALEYAKRKMNDAYVEIRWVGRDLRSRNPSNKMKRYAGRMQQLNQRLNSDGNYSMLGHFTDVLENTQATSTETDALCSALTEIEELTLVLSAREKEPVHKGYLRQSFSQSLRHINEAFWNRPKPGNGAKVSREALQRVQSCLKYYFDRFEYYDMLTFPIYYGTSVGESDIVEVLRISPEDATDILGPAKSRKKLAGTKLGSFGAFFVREWRENDMLWGRLDAAECLLKAILPDGADDIFRAQLIREAQLAILEEDWKPVAKGLENLLDDFKKNYRVNLNFPPGATLKVSSRASNVLSELLNGLSEQYPNPIQSLARLGGIFFRILRAILQNSFGYSIFRAFLLKRESKSDQMQADSQSLSLDAHKELSKIN